MDNISNQIISDFVTSGRKVEIQEDLRTGLERSGWTAKVRGWTREEMKENPNIPLEELYSRINARAQAQVPDEVKSKLYENVSKFIDRELDKHRGQIRELVLAREITNVISGNSDAQNDGQGSSN